MVATAQHWFNYPLLNQIITRNKQMKNYRKSLIHQENVQWWLLLICQTLLNSQANNVVLAKWCTVVLPIMSDLTWEQEVDHRKLWSDIRPALFLVCLKFKRHSKELLQPISFNWIIWSPKFSLIINRCLFQEFKGVAISIVHGSCPGFGK
jgi:hypothetical protein